MNNTIKSHLVVSLFLLLFTGSLASAQNNNNNSPPQPVPQLTVWDSKGNRVSSVLGLFDPGVNGRAIVALTASQTLLVLQVERTRFVGTELLLLFTSTDCTGTVFLVPESIGGMHQPAAVWNGVVYVPDPSAPQPSLAITVKSVAYFDVTSGRCEDISRDPFEVSDPVQAKKLLDLNSFFTPPFTIRQM